MNRAERQAPMLVTTNLMYRQRPMNFMLVTANLTYRQEPKNLMLVTANLMLERAWGSKY